MTLFDEPFAETEHFEATIVFDHSPHEPDWGPEVHWARKTRAYIDEIVYDDRGYERAYYRIGIQSGSYSSSHSRIPPGFRTQRDWADDNYDAILYASKKELVDFAWGKLKPGPSAEQVWLILESMAEVWCAYWNGDVYAWKVDAKDGIEAVGDSCWGYYGDRELPYVEECARESLAAAEEEYQKRELEEWRDIPAEDLRHVTQMAEA